jgi:drug/metabolite transporter (DMT)-like permease
MVAFAGNSLLCRMALGTHAIDSVSFSTIRFASGALALLAFSALSRHGIRGGSWIGAAVLFFYALPFAAAYSVLTTGMGALILFGMVQFTMIAAGLFAGERPLLREWTGLAVAAAGLVWLVMPGLSTSPSPQGVVWMSVAGVAWGIYSLLGRRSVDPVAATTGTFLRLLPALLAISALYVHSTFADRTGVMLAAVSGVVTTGGGYVVWYHALRRLTATRASILHLSVPGLAAVAGTLVLAEPMTIRLVTSAALILGGVALSVARRQAV